MRAKQIIREDLSMDTRVMETDHEVQMARADLFKIAKYSVELHKILKNISEAEGLEGWVQAKITKAADYISSVKHHLEYEQAEVDVPQDANATIGIPAESITEGEYTEKEIKMAIGIAFDPRYKQGNMTGAVTAINKIKSGLADHPKVSDALRRANESKGE